MAFLERFQWSRFDKLIGVDFGAKSIKLCLLKPLKTGFRLEHLICKDYEEEIMHDGALTDPFFLGEELKKMIKESNIKAKHAASAVTSYTVISKYISLPFMEGEELEGAITAEVENVIPIPLKDIYYSFSPLGKNPENEELLDVFVVAVKKEIVDDFRRTFDYAGLVLDVLDVDSIAFANLVEELYNPLPESSFLIVDIGSAITNIVVMKNGRIQLSREILFGGNLLTEQIVKVTNLSFKEAELKKIRADPDLTFLFENFYYNIVSELKKTVNFYLSTKPNEKIETIYLTGGSSLLQGLKERIENELKIGIQFIDPFLLLIEEKSLKELADLRYKSALAIYLSSRVRDMKEGV